VAASSARLFFFIFFGDGSVEASVTSLKFLIIVEMYANFYLLRTKLLPSSSTRKFNHEDVYECVLILDKEGVELPNTYGCCLLLG